ncbi:MAG: hypothetical protein WDN72_01675 [Alphaproteobacteria bacterium]
MAETEQEPMAETPPGEKADRRRRSKGERAFDWIFYGPMYATGTFLISALLAVVQKRKFPSLHENIFKSLERTGLNEHTAEALTGTFLTMWGGIAMLVPLKLAEDKKVSLATKWNRWKGDPTSAEEIAAAPKQTWWSLAAGRLSAMAMTFAGMLVLSLPQVLGGFFSRASTWSGEKFTKTFGLPHYDDPALVEGLKTQADALKARMDAVPKSQRASAMGKEVRNLRMHKLLEVESHETFGYTLGKMLAIDAVVTGVVAAMLYASSHFFAKRQVVHRERREEKLEAQIERYEEHHQRKTAPAMPETVPQSKVRASTVEVQRQSPLPEGMQHG